MKRGFTLIELLVALAILAILATIAVPMYRGYQKGAARQEATANLQALVLCLEQYYAENSSYANATSFPTTYSWEMNASGTVTTDDFSDWLPCFNPRKAAGGAVNKYKYTLQVSSATAFTATATGLRGPVKDDVLTIDQDGVKGGSWPK
jgi:type IV pilus assembly protein PilE